ncbi:hypothetical protein [uncultured Thiodictyon sp.]|uniref:hypothetical protein n=1 Tax=uncultured Thiodictyon sp. TaxID=1846217 RepID=UPI0025E7AEE5|nr:hypothetical protein [uncultured Thiodictyon sp.]
MNTIPAAAIEFVKELEGFRANAYPDPLPIGSGMTQPGLQNNSANTTTMGSPAWCDAERPRQRYFANRAKTIPD